MGPQEDQCRNLFPIPAKKVAGEMLRRVYWSPATWLPLFLALAVGFRARTQVAVLVTGATTVIGVAIYWASQWRKLVKAARHDVILDRAQEQNRVLYRKAHKLRDKQCEEDGDTLRRFIDLKASMDKVILRTGDLTPEHEKTKALIDTICFEVADELARLSEFRQLLRKSGEHFTQDKRQSIEDRQGKLEQQIDSAYQALMEMHEQLESMLSPDHPLMGAGANLNATIAQVREEAEIARRVRKRIEADNLAALLSETDQATSQKVSAEE